MTDWTPPSTAVRMLMEYIALEPEEDRVYKIVCACGADFGNDGHFVLTETIEALCDRCFRRRPLDDTHEISLHEAVAFAAAVHRFRGTCP